MNQSASHTRHDDLSRKKLRIWFPYLLVLLILCIAFGLRLSYVLTLDVEAPIRNDSLTYSKIAYNIITNGAYSRELNPPFTKETAVTPGYPLFLSTIVALSSDVDNFYNKTLLVQVFLSTISVILTYLIFKSYLPWFFSSIGLFLVAISPHLIIYSGYVLTETLFTFFLLLGTLFYTKSIKKQSHTLTFMAGVIWGMASLTRPAFLLFPFVLLLFSWCFSRCRKKVLKIHIVMIFGLMVMWIPWNVLTFNEPSSYSASAASFALGSYPNLVYKSEKFKGYPYKEDPAFNEMKKDIRTCLAIVAERVREAPIVYCKWYLFGKSKMYWDAYTVTGVGGAFVYSVKSSIYHQSKLLQISYSKMMHAHIFFAAIALLLSFVVIVNSIYYKTFDTENLTIIISALLLFYFTVIHIIFAPLPRYSVPLFPFSYMLAAVFMSLLFKWGKNIILDEKSNCKGCF